MPSIFKTLATITVWILFVFGCLSLAAGFVRIFMGNNTAALIGDYLGFGVASLVLSVVSARLRQTMG